MNLYQNSGVIKAIRNLTIYKPAFVCLSLWAFTSCRVSLSEEHYKKSLDEALHVENFKENYTLFLDKPASAYQIRLQTPPKTVRLNTTENGADSAILLKKMKSRPYLNVVLGEDTTVMANRHIYFNKVLNFRDLGGIRTKEAKMVRWGMVYRSGNLSGLKDREFARFGDMRIATVFDLRTEKEIKSKEDHLPANVKYVHAPMVQDNEGEIAQLRTRVIKGEISEQQAKDKTVEFYQDAVTTNLGAYRNILHQITDSGQPVLYHCSAGNDRTGIVSALMLAILNVDRQTIINEYLLSNYYRRVKTEKMLGKAKLARIIKPKMDLKAIEVFMGVDEIFINAVFEVIDKKYGGIDQFIENQLGFDQTARERVIEKFTY